MHIVLVETTSVRGFDIVEEMANLDIEVSFVAQNLSDHWQRNSASQMAHAARLIEVPELGSPCNLPDILDGQLGNNPVDGVICRYENYLRDVSLFATAHKIPGESSETARLLTDKSAVRKRLADVGLGSLRWKIASSLDEAVEAACQLKFPLVVKPIAGGRSQGVTIVCSVEGLRGAVSEALAVPDGAGSCDFGGVLLEQFVPGSLVSAEILIQDSQPFFLGFGARLASPPGITAEIGGHFPATFDCMEEVQEFASSVIQALGISNSAIHMELMLTEHGPELIEVNGRVAGYVVAQQISHALNRSVFKDLVDIAVGRPITRLIDQSMTVAIRSLWSTESGTVRSIIDTSQSVSAMSQVIMHEVNVQTGDRVAPLRGNSDRFGFVMASGNDAHEANSAAKAAADEIIHSVQITDDASGCHHTSITSRDRDEHRQHVLILDRVGPTSWLLPEGAPLFPVDRYRTSAISAATDPGEGWPYEDLHQMDVFGDPEGVVATAIAIDAASPVHKVAAISEKLLLPAARLRKLFHADGDNASFVNNFVDKFAMKQIAQKAGIPCAEGFLIGSSEDLWRALRLYGSVVVKPRAGSGSQGVQFIENDSAANAWLASHYSANNFLVEKIVHGEMCHIDAFVSNDNLLWDMSCYATSTLAYKRGAPLSAYTPADVKLRSDARTLLERVVDAWKMKAGVLHLEAFITSSGLVFCEVAARPGGAGVVPAFEATRGINLSHAKLLLDCGENPARLLKDPVAYYSGWTVHYCSSGILEHYDDSAVSASAYYRKVAAEPGDAVGQSRFSGTGLSTLVFAEDSADRILRLIEQAESTVRISVLPQQTEQE